jgi:hypothetical protein
LLDIFFRPLIQTNGLNFGHVCSKTTMNATAVYADEDTETDIRPVWIWFAAVGAHVIALLLPQF